MPTLLLYEHAYQAKPSEHCTGWTELTWLRRQREMKTKIKLLHLKRISVGIAPSVAIVMIGCQAEIVAFVIRHRSVNLQHLALRTAEFLVLAESHASHIAQIRVASVDLDYIAHPLSLRFAGKGQAADVERKP